MSLSAAQAEGARLREQLLKGSAELLGNLSVSQVHQTPTFFAWEQQSSVGAENAVVMRTSESRDEYKVHELQKRTDLPQPHVWSPNSLSLADMDASK